MPNTEPDLWFRVNTDPHLSKDLSIQGLDEAKELDKVSFSGSQVWL